MSGLSSFNTAVTTQNFTSDYFLIVRCKITSTVYKSNIVGVVHVVISGPANPAADPRQIRRVIALFK